MSALLGEQTLLGLLPDQGSIEVMAREGVPLEVIPTEALRPVVAWALAYYRQSLKAPTVAVLKDRYDDLLTDHTIDLDDEPEESIEWALDALMSAYVRSITGTFAREVATTVAQCLPEERLSTLSLALADMQAVVQDLQPRTTQVDMRASVDSIVADYQQAVDTQGQVIGLGFGLPDIDRYTGGIRPGEVCIVAGPAKVGKSYWMDLVALKEWEAGRSPALFTLENSIEMTQMRIACLANHISTTEMQAGTLSEADYETLITWLAQVLEPASNPLHIFSPLPSQRTPHGIVQAARAVEADSLIVDQLTFVETSRVKREQSRAYELRDILHDFKEMVSTGREPLPVLLAHQINRDGIKTAEKTGRLSMSGLADSSEVERAADWVFGLYASEDDREARQMQFQGLAARRAPARSFRLQWAIDVGLIGVIPEIEEF